MENPKIILFGTGNAMVTQCYNTCFAIEINGKHFMVDAGGGNGILKQIEKLGIEYKSINHLFVTHNHTDHILGVVWIIRKIASLMVSGKYAEDFNLYGSSESIALLKTICNATLKQKELKLFDSQIKFNIIQNESKINALGMMFTVFDICSTKKLQYGFRVSLPNGKTLVCLGDEPYNEQCEKFVIPCDWLLCEAFCLYSDRDRFKPYEKHHSTAQDVGNLATKIGTKNIIVYHTEDKTLKTRKETYTAEISKGYNGAIYVPNDLEIIEID